MPHLTLNLPGGETRTVTLNTIPTLEELRRQYSSYAKREHMELHDYFPCMECNGRGKIYDPDEQPCPVEGNKLRSLIPCGVCQSSGRSTKEVYDAKLQEVKERVEEANAELTRKVNLTQSLLDKATLDEWKALSTLLRG